MNQTNEPTEELPSIHKFWAKTKTNTEKVKNGTQSYYPDILELTIPEHSLAVIATAVALQNLKPQKHPAFPFITGIHDVGKFGPMFSLKNENLCPVNDWVEIHKKRKNYTEYKEEFKHAAISQWYILEKHKTKTIAEIIGGHHGKFTPNESIKNAAHEKRGNNIININYAHYKMQVLQKCAELEQYLIDTTHLKPNKQDVPKKEKAFWAGYTTIADWIGSNQSVFNRQLFDTNPTFETLITKAEELIKKYEFTLPEPIEQKFHKLFKFEENSRPNEIQKITTQTITEPGIYILEAPMGSGKTEAALHTAHLCLQNKNNKQTGIYFALPTQATANAMLPRIQNWCENGFSEKIKTKIIHANANLHQKELLENLEKDAQNWMKANKRAILAPIAIGTVDQIILSIMRVKHFAVRQYALSNKIIIIDEVHSYDTYTANLLKETIHTLKNLNCIIIILSATLTQKAVEQILDIKNKLPKTKKTTAQITYVKNTETNINCIPIDYKVEEKKYQIEFDIIDDTIKPTKQFVDKIIQKLENGEKILWIRNTILAAQKTYIEVKTRIKETNKQRLNIGLLHSRFKYNDRKTKEEYWIKAFGKHRTNNMGELIIGTQILEQSIDIDADTLITDLCPIDMLLQRIGRCWRHNQHRPINKPTVIIQTPEKIEGKETNRWGRIYSKYTLHRTLETIKNLKEIKIPEQISNLIENTYEEKNETNKIYIQWKNTDIEIKNKQELKAENAKSDTAGPVHDDPDDTYFETNEDSEEVDQKPQTRIGQKTINLIIIDETIQEEDYQNHTVKIPQTIIKDKKSEKIITHIDNNGKLYLNKEKTKKFEVIQNKQTTQCKYTEEMGLEYS